MDERACDYCGKPLRPGARSNQRYCGKTHKRQARRQAKRREEQHASRVTKYPPLANMSVTELHDQSGPPPWRNDPRNYSDFGEPPDDYDIAAEIDAGVYDVDDDQQTARFNAMLQADAGERTPRETWRKWRAYGRRHGTEHPEQTTDRIARHRAAEAARTGRIDRSTAGRVQDRFDTRTAANVADSAQQSRRLNARHVEQPPLASPQFDFQAESVSGGPYRRGWPSGQRSGHADYASDLGTTGFIY